MLETLRNHARKFYILIWLIVASFILSIFLVWGKGSFNPFSNWVAKVGSEEITYQDYATLMEKLSQFYRQQGIAINEEVKRDIKNQALNILISDSINLALAQKAGFTTTTKEMTEVLLSIKEFYENGRFSKEKYINVLKSLGVTPREFEKNLTKEITIKKLQLTIGEGTITSDGELKRIAKWNLARGKLECLILDPEKIKSKITLKEEELRDYYNKNKDKFKTKEEINAIVIKIKPQSEEEKKDTIKKLEKLTKEAKNTTNLIQLAKNLGIPYKEENVLEDNDLIDIVNNIKNLKTNEVSSILKSKDYYVVVGIKNKNEAKLLSYEEAKNIIENEIKNNKLETFIKEMIERANKSQADLKDIAKDFGGNPVTIENVTRGIVKVGGETFKSLGNISLSKKKGELGYAIENNKIVVFKLIEKEMPHESEIEEFIKNHKKQIIEAKANKIWADLMVSSKDRFKVEINKKLVGEKND